MALATEVADKMAQRGVVYVVWGEAIEPMLQRSITSLRRHHPELPVHVERLPDGSQHRDKPRMFDVSPFEETLFLDADTVVLDRLDFAFEKAQRFALACCICESPWARRHAGISGDVIEYNTGVLFFTRAAESIFRRWAEIVYSIDATVIMLGPNQSVTRQVDSDQAGFAQAVDDLRFNPYVLPLNWNLRPAWQKNWFGPIKIWHWRSPPPDRLVEWNDGQRQPGSIIRYAGAGL